MIDPEEYRRRPISCIQVVYVAVFYHKNFVNEFELPLRVLPVGTKKGQVQNYCLEFLHAECEDEGLPVEGVEIEWREFGSECTIGEDNMAYGYRFFIHKRFVI
jgi:hypothetical protein